VSLSIITLFTGWWMLSKKALPQAGDPLFVNAAGADFHLQVKSPAIDKAFSIDAPDNDLDGHSRPYGAGYDIGADEYIVLTNFVFLPIILRSHIPLRSADQGFSIDENLPK
jgi:hypothetical protein